MINIAQILWSLQSLTVEEGCAKKMSDPWTQNDRLYGQDFKKLQASHLKSKSLFEDPHFPPNSSSLSYSGNVVGDSARLGKCKEKVGNKSHMFQKGNIPIEGEH